MQGRSDGYLSFADETCYPISRLEFRHPADPGDLEILRAEVPARRDVPVVHYSKTRGER